MDYADLLQVKHTLNRVDALLAMMRKHEHWMRRMDRIAANVQRRADALCAKGEYAEADWACRRFRELHSRVYDRINAQLDAYKRAD